MGKKVVAKMKSIIEAYCADSPVKLEDGRKYGHFPKTSKSIGDLSALIEALGHKEPKVRRNAARLLGYHRQEAEEAIPALTMALEDRCHEVVKCAIDALRQITPLFNE